MSRRRHLRWPRSFPCCLKRGSWLSMGRVPPSTTVISSTTSISSTTAPSLLPASCSLMPSHRSMLMNSAIWSPVMEHPLWKPRRARPSKDRQLPQSPNCRPCRALLLELSQSLPTRVCLHKSTLSRSLRYHPRQHTILLQPSPLLCRRRERLSGDRARPGRAMQCPHCRRQIHTSSSLLGLGSWKTASVALPCKLLSRRRTSLQVTVEVIQLQPHGAGRGMLLPLATSLLLLRL